MSVSVVAELGSGVFKIQEGELEWCCQRCLEPVVQVNQWFECACGCSFVLSIVGPFNLDGQPFLLVAPELAERQDEPCSEPEPEA